MTQTIYKPGRKIKSILIAASLLTFGSASAQNVFDDVIATSTDHTYLEAALIKAELDDDLQDGTNLTVFAPNDDAFTSLATALGTDIDGLLALDNLADILTYHVIGAKVMAGDISNGQIVEPLSMTNTLKLTKTAQGDVYVNQAMVASADIDGGNGYVHVIDAVVLPNETVVDVAIDNEFTSLTTAVVTAELLPALTDPLAELTVFAPTNEAFSTLASDLGTDINGILEREDLADILKYHVLGSKVFAADLSEGLGAPTLQSQDVTFSLTSGATINGIVISSNDIDSDNGVVHVIDGVLIPAEEGGDEPTAISDDFITTTVSVFPNPSKGLVNIQGIDNITSVSISNSIGSEVFRSEGSNSTLNTNELSPGLYYVTVYSENQKHLVKITVR